MSIAKRFPGAPPITSRCDSVGFQYLHECLNLPQDFRAQAALCPCFELPHCSRNSGARPSSLSSAYSLPKKN